MKRFGLAMAMTAILLTILPAPARASILTAGQYAYILQGKELEVPVDLVALQGTYLMPEELVRTLGLTIETDNDLIRIARNPVTVQVSLGSDEATVDGEVHLLNVSPMQIARRFFLPIEVLDYFGIEVRVEGKMVVINDSVRLLGELPELSQSLPERFFREQTVETTLHDRQGAYGDLKVTFLTKQLLGDARIRLPWGIRVKLLARVRTRSILLVTITNTSARTIRLDPLDLFLTGEAGDQARYLNAEIPVTGSVTEPLAPGARRTSVLIYSKVAGPISLFDGNFSTPLGQVTGE